MLMHKWLIAGLIAALLAAALTVQTARLTAARKAEAAAHQTASQWRTNFEAMEATNAANVRAMEKLTAETKRIEAEATAARRANARLATQYDALQQRITHAPTDRALSAELCTTFNELRRIQAQPGLACGD